ncbi:MAG: rRNA maturation RNase YbeY [Puniceicoccales bacterium]|jgi:probable rRNA maturation factor|nr:rRNA maturation RNase YbeY [Puniceicoccales bacterium]
MRTVQTYCEVAGFDPAPECVQELFRLLDKWRGRRAPAGWLSVAFVSDATICALHEEFLGDPSRTDVITFPGDDGTASTATGDAAGGEPFAGEICVCVPQARREARKRGTGVAGEVLLYLVHGWLHLTGLDDIAESDRAAMRAGEASALAWLSKRGFAPLWEDCRRSSGRKGASPEKTSQRRAHSTTKKAAETSSTARAQRRASRSRRAVAP